MPSNLNSYAKINETVSAQSREVNPFLNDIPIELISYEDSNNLLTSLNITTGLGNTDKRRTLAKALGFSSGVMLALGASGSRRSTTPIYKKIALTGSWTFVANNASINGTGGNLLTGDELRVNEVIFTSSGLSSQVQSVTSDNQFILYVPLEVSSSSVTLYRMIPLTDYMDSQRKELGEVFSLSELKAASSDFPAICLAQNNATIWKSGNPLGAGNIPGNFADLVDYLRAIPLRFDPLNANNIDFTVTDWSYSGATITLTFAYTTPKGTKESKVIRSLHEDAFVHNENNTIGVDYSAFEDITSWRTITLSDPLRDDTDAIQVPIGTYQITSIAGGESAAAQIKFVHSATPTGTPKVESRLMQFYPYRIQDAGQNLDVDAAIKALHFAVQGRGFVTVDNADSSEWVGGLRRRDRLQGFSITPAGVYGLAGGSVTGYDGGGGFYGISAALGVAGSFDTLRSSNTTDSRGLGLYPYIWAKSYA